MKKGTITVLIGLSFLTQLFAQASGIERYQYTIDLTNVVDDKLFIQLQVPKIPKDEIEYIFPKIIPGAYWIADYGRFVSGLMAYDKNDEKLVVERIDNNRWRIQNANKLAKLTYWVEDTYDTEIEKPIVFAPAGTNIEEGKNFVINPSGFFGYFEDLKQLPIEFDIIRPENFYGGTGLIGSNKSDLFAPLESDLMTDSADGKRIDTYLVESYDRLVDSPLMYAEPDTAIIRVANTEVLISSYSSNKIVNSGQIAETIRDVLLAQNQYLGGVLPVDKYAFIFCFSNQPVSSYGALEHSFSSMYYMPEKTIQAMQQQLRDYAAHEFFHIVTPLTIHSEEIHEFGFNEPNMSKHLWLYEGVTEFFSDHMQVKYDLITEEKYLEVMQNKMVAASRYIDSVAFTDISKGILDKYKTQFVNVYNKGALIGMMLEIKLRELSNGKYGVKHLAKDLSIKYGKDRPFKDDELFDEITALTYPEIGEFLITYVGGNQPLPYQKIFAKVGVIYIAEEKYLEVDLGTSNEVIDVNEDGSIFIDNGPGLNAFARKLGLQEGDVIKKINDVDLPELGPKISPYIEARQAELLIGEKFSYTILRDGKEIRLDATVFEIEKTRQHVVSFDEDASEEQLALRKSWLKP